MRCLVTGGCGFIGSHFVRHLLKKHEDYTVINLDKLSYAADPSYLSDIESSPLLSSRYRFVEGDCGDIDCCRALFDEGIDLVFHFAAESHVDRGLSAPLVFAQNNTIGTLTLLEAWRTSSSPPSRLRRFVHISTDEVYGSTPAGVISTETSLLHPGNPYSASKAAAEMFLAAYHNTYNLPYVITRSSNNYGPCQHREKFIPTCILNASAHIPIPIFGTGLQRRDWIYVEDNCTAIDLIAARGALGECYNISTGQEIENLEVAKHILGHFGIPLTEGVSHVPDRLGHDFHYTMDHTKLRALGWECVTPFAVGLRRTIEWYLKTKEEKN